MFAGAAGSAVVTASLPMTLHSFAGDLALSHEKRLIKDLIDTYEKAGKTGRPVKNSSEAILLKYGLGLVQILRLDEKNQVLTIRAWNRLVCSLGGRWW